MDNFIQITVFCPPESQVGAFVYRNAGKSIARCDVVMRQGDTHTSIAFYIMSFIN